MNQVVEKTKTNSWIGFISDEMKKEYFINIQKIIDGRARKRIEVYPKPEQVFNCFRLTKFENTRIVILGQDPYHTPGTAHGLAFSTLQSKTPPSLMNIFREIQQRIYPNHEMSELFQSNNLASWAKQGVLLLNTALTVEKGSPGIHTDLWRPFILKALRKLSQLDECVNWLCWGKKAVDLVDSLDLNFGHRVYKSSHPSPYSAHGFFGKSGIPEALNNTSFIYNQDIDLRIKNI